MSIYQILSYKHIYTYKILFKNKLTTQNQTNLDNNGVAADFVCIGKNTNIS